MRRGGNGQRGFAEAFLGADVRSNRKLESISAQLDWDALGAVVDGLRTGRPPYAPLVMVRVLLQQWYGLSDVEVCEALADRLSFRRFCGLSLDEATPDDTTLSRFRTALGQAGLGAVYDYKAHVAADDGTGLVRDVLVTSADIHDTLAFTALIQGDEAAAYADRAYDSAANRAALAEAGVRDRIMHRARRNRPMRPWQRWHNRVLGPVRGGIERIFGTWKRSWGLRRMRYRGLDRYHTHLHLVAAAWNLLRAATLSAA